MIAKRIRNVVAPTAVVTLAVFALGLFAALSGVSAQTSVGQPDPWGMGMQASASEIMSQIRWFEAYTLIIITVITLFVLALMIYVVVRYRAKANPTPSRTTHNTMVEVVWTVVPVLILVAIAFPSFRLLYNQTTIPAPDLTVKIIGGQWYWNYEYQDEGLAEIGTMTSYMLDDDQRAERMGEYSLPESEVPRLLAVDYPLVVPVDSVVHILTTAIDVNHAVAFPAFGVKADSVVGRTNESWFNAEAEGIYYGQCSQLCGRLHAFMPLEVRVLSQERFDEWAEIAKTDLDQATVQLLEWQSEAVNSGTPVAMN